MWPDSPATSRSMGLISELSSALHTRAFKSKPLDGNRELISQSLNPSASLAGSKKSGRQLP